MDARQQAWLDQEDARIAEVIRHYGWAIEYIGGGVCSVPGCACPEDEGPPFAYTVGLFGMAHPELLIFSVPPQTAAAVLNDLGERIRSGESLMPGRLVTLDDWAHRIIPEEVPNPGEIVFSANRYYQRPPVASVPVLQLTHDDMNGRFPWEEGCTDPEIQPRPGTFRA